MTKTPAFSLVLAAALAAGSVAAAPPPNETCSAAVTISAGALPYLATVDTTEATNDTGDPAMPCVSPAPTRSVWYSFTPAVTDSYRIDTAGTTPADYEPVITVYTGTCGNLTPVLGACDRGRVIAALAAGVTYRISVAGAAVTVSPSIKVLVNGLDVCPPGGGPGGGGVCGTTFDVKVGDTITAIAYNELAGRPIPANGGTFSWTLGTGATPATASTASVAFKYGAPVSSTLVTLVYTAPGGSPITQSVEMRVAAATARPAPESSRELALPAPFTPLSLADTAILPSAGGLLNLSVERVPPSYPYAYMVPSVAHSVGQTGQTFVSDVSVTNADTADATVALQFWPDSGVVTSDAIALPLNGTKQWADVVRSGFGIGSGFGALLVQSSRRLAVGARTYANVSGGGSNGQFATAVDVTSANSAGLLATGEQGVFTAIQVDSAFRSNVGFFNVSSKACTVSVEVRDPDGKRVGNAVNLTIPSQRYVQKSVGSDIIPGQSLLYGSVVVTNTTDSCLVGGIAYVIDNVSSDPFAVPLKKK